MRGQVAEVREKLAAQPMFCFETAVKMWYWSALVYDYQQVCLPWLALAIRAAPCLAGCSMHYIAKPVGAPLMLLPAK